MKQEKGHCFAVLHDIIIQYEYKSFAISQKFHNVTHIYFFFSCYVISASICRHMNTLVSLTIWSCFWLGTKFHCRRSREKFFFAFSLIFDVIFSSIADLCMRSCHSLIEAEIIRIFVENEEREKGSHLYETWKFKRVDKKRSEVNTS